LAPNRFPSSAGFLGNYNEWDAPAPGWDLHIEGVRMSPNGVRKLYPNQSRIYSCTLGRWGAEDPAGYVDGNNLYQFVQSQPTDMTDPDGLAKMPHADCLSVVLTFDPEPVKWTWEVVAGEWHIGFHILADWSFVGHLSAMRFGYAEKGALVITPRGDTGTQLVYFTARFR
jgi:RHS repeat-associated protein